MKTKNKILSVVVLMTLLMAGITAFASSYEETLFCETCTARLNVGATALNRWTESHLAETNLVDSNNNPIYENCTVSHERTKVEKTCPNGHGVKWSNVQHDIRHSGRYCTIKDQKYWENN